VEKLRPWNKKVEDYDVPDGAQLFLSLKAGVGGNGK